MRSKQCSHGRCLFWCLLRYNKNLTADTHQVSVCHPFRPLNLLKIQTSNNHKLVFCHLKDQFINPLKIRCTNITNVHHTQRFLTQWPSVLWSEALNRHWWPNFCQSHYIYPKIIWKRKGYLSFPKLNLVVFLKIQGYSLICFLDLVIIIININLNLWKMKFIHLNKNGIQQHSVQRFSRGLPFYK